MNEHGIWFEDQNVILHIFSNEFCRLLEKDHNIDHSTLCVITFLDNERLTYMATDEEIIG